MPQEIEGNKCMTQTEVACFLHSFANLKKPRFFAVTGELAHFLVNQTHPLSLNDLPKSIRHIDIILLNQTRDTASDYKALRKYKHVSVVTVDPTISQNDPTFAKLFTFTAVLLEGHAIGVLCAVIKNETA